MVRSVGTPKPTRQQGAVDPRGSGGTLNLLIVHWRN